MQRTPIIPLLLAFFLSACTPQTVPQSSATEQVPTSSSAGLVLAPLLKETAATSSSTADPSPTAGEELSPSPTPLIPSPIKTEEPERAGALLPPNDQVWLANSSDFILLDPQSSPIALPHQSSFRVVAPDGNSVAFVQNDQNSPKSRVLISQRDTSREIELPGTVVSLVFDPNSDKLAISTFEGEQEWRIYLVNLQDGRLQEIAKQSNSNWEEDPVVKLLNWNEQGILIQRIFWGIDRGSADIELFHPESGQFTSIYSEKADAAISSHDGNYSLIRTGEGPLGDSGPDYGLLRIDHRTGAQDLIEERGAILIDQMAFSPDNRHYFYTRAVWNEPEDALSLNLKSINGSVAKAIYFDDVPIKNSLVASSWLDNNQLLLLFKGEEVYNLYRLPIDQFSRSGMINMAKFKQNQLEVLYIPTVQAEDPQSSHTTEAEQQGMVFPPSDQIWLRNGSELLLVGSQTTPFALPSGLEICSVSPKGNLILVCKGDGRYQVIHRQGSYELAVPGDTISIAFDPNNDRLAISTTENQYWRVFVVDPIKQSFQITRIQPGESIYEEPSVRFLDWTEKGILVHRIFWQVDGMSKDIELFDPDKGTFTTIYDQLTSGAFSSHNGNYSVIHTGIRYAGDGISNFGLLLIDHLSGTQRVIEEMSPVIFDIGYVKHFAADDQHYFYTVNHSPDGKGPRTLVVRNIDDDSSKSLSLDALRSKGKLYSIKWLDNQNLLLDFRTEQSYDLYSLAIDPLSEGDLQLLVSVPNPDARLVYIPQPQP